MSVHGRQGSQLWWIKVAVLKVVVVVVVPVVAVVERVWVVEVGETLPLWIRSDHPGDGGGGGGGGGDRDGARPSGCC